MNKLSGIPTLNAGAPDLRLSGEHNRGSYVQRRRAQMAGGGIMGSNAGSMLVAPTADGSRPGYGWKDWIPNEIKDPIAKVYDKLIPNELKSPTGAALVGGALINQFGLPNILTSNQYWDYGTDVGQNWIGELLEGVLPGDAQFNTVIGDKLPFMYPETWLPTGAMGDAKNWNLSNLMPGEWDFEDAKTAALKGLTGIGSMGATDLKVAAQQKVYDEINKKLGTNFQTGSDQQQTTTQQTGAWDTGKWGPKPNWQGPLAIGTTIGLADHLTRSDDKMPAQLAIAPSSFATAEAAMADPNLRFKPQAQYANVAEGGRIGYNRGRVVNPGGYAGEKDFSPEEQFKRVEAARKLVEEQGISMQEALDITLSDSYIVRPEEVSLGSGLAEEAKQHIMSKTDEIRRAMQESGVLDLVEPRAQGGRIGAQEGGLMNLGGMEKDYRQEGGFVPIGGAEKADDVPARLSKNEFVFTADAVRNAGGGDIDEGAAVMERLMENLEAGGKVSEESQGLEGAQEMFANTQRLQNRII